MSELEAARVENQPLLEHKNFFPGPLLRTIHMAALDQAGRKRTYQFTDLNHFLIDTVPIAVVNAARFARIVLRQELNTAILKRYDTEDDYVSQAYEFHTDPERFSQSKLIFCTIDGNARLEVKDIADIDCAPNTAVVMNPDLEHKITPPQNETGIRHFLFLGNDYTI